MGKQVWQIKQISQVCKVWKKERRKGEMEEGRGFKYLVPGDVISLPLSIGMLSIIASHAATPMVRSNSGTSRQ